MGAERLDKLLASTGRWSRREAKVLIKEGRVLLDGLPAKSAEQRITLELCRITVDGVGLDWRAFTYIMFLNIRTVVCHIVFCDLKRILSCCLKLGKLLPAHL